MSVSAILLCLRQWRRPVYVRQVSARGLHVAYKPSHWHQHLWRLLPLHGLSHSRFFWGLPILCKFLTILVKCSPHILLQGFYRGPASVLLESSDCWVPFFSHPLAVQGDYQLTTQSQVKKDPLLLLHFILTSISPTGNPAILMSEMLKAFLPGETFLYREIEFNISTDSRLAAHDSILKKLLSEIER